MTPTPTSEEPVEQPAADDGVPEYKRGVAWIDGAFVPAAEATVSIFDHSFLYGDGAFESIVCRHGRPFALEPHLDRLFMSMTYLRIDLPLSREELTRLVTELLERNGLSEGYVRIVVSRGEGYPVSDPRKAIRPTVVLSVQAKPAVVRDPDEGVKLLIASTRRIPPICMEPRVKSNNYLNHIVAKLEALAAGADDAILLDLDGNVAELPVANVFALNRGELATPPSHGILAGVTRRTVMKIVAEGAVAAQVVERTMAPYDLFNAEELFVVGTGTAVAHVASVDGRPIGDGRRGPVTAAIAKAYDRVIDAETLGAEVAR